VYFRKFGESDDKLPEYNDLATGITQRCVAVIVDAPRRAITNSIILS
jgi:hypothetical protein